MKRLRGLLRLMHIGKRCLSVSGIGRRKLRADLRKRLGARSCRWLRGKRIGHRTLLRHAASTLLRILARSRLLGKLSCLRKLPSTRIRLRKRRCPRTGLRERTGSGTRLRIGAGTGGGRSLYAGAGRGGRLWKDGLAERTLHVLPHHAFVALEHWMVGTIGARILIRHPIQTPLTVAQAARSYIFSVRARLAGSMRGAFLHRSRISSFDNTSSAVNAKHWPLSFSHPSCTARKVPQGDLCGDGWLGQRGKSSELVEG